MASVWQHPKSKYWTACWTDETGHRRKRSTKLTKRSEAQKLADTWEATYRRQISRGQAQKVIAELFEPKGAQLVTVGNMVRSWLEENKPSVSASTYSIYSRTVKLWLESMADRERIPLIHISRSDLLTFRKTLEAGHPVTGNQRLKLLRMILKDAKEKGYHFDDPFIGVRMFREQKEAAAETGGRRPFTNAELQTLLSLADHEWKSLILFGLYTGQRLGDIAGLRWGQVDLERRLLSLTTKKTSRAMVLPIMEPLAQHLVKETVPAERKAFVHPRAAGLVAGAKGKVSTLSRHFGELLEQAGLREARKSAAPKGHTSTGKGRTALRTLEELSFHSLRHTARTMLEAAGVPLATAMHLLGHSDKGSSLQYTHLDPETLRRAAEKLPHFE